MNIFEWPQWPWQPWSRPWRQRHIKGIRDCTRRSNNKVPQLGFTKQPGTSSQDEIHATHEAGPEVVCGNKDTLNTRNRTEETGPPHNGEITLQIAFLVKYGTVIQYTTRTSHMLWWCNMHNPSKYNYQIAPLVVKSNNTSHPSATHILAYNKSCDAFTTLGTDETHRFDQLSHCFQIIHINSTVPSPCMQKL